VSCGPLRVMFRVRVRFKVRVRVRVRARVRMVYQHCLALVMGSTLHSKSSP
jgi:hypothetical protein